MSGQRIRERKRGPLDKAGVWRACHQKKKEREGNGGGPVRGTTVRGREPTGRQEKEKCTVHKDSECGPMLRPRENGKLRTQYRQRS